jgi:FAD/FMN-containing dehydrogenase
MTLSPTLITQFASIVGDKYALTDPAAMASHLHEPRDLYHGRSPLVLKPGSTAEVAAILKLANETRTVIVPQGGNTGLVGGQTADQFGEEVILSLSRLNRIREFDLDGNCVVVEAGVVLETLARAAAEHDRLFPLWLASAGSCQIGGNLASNAGGTQVLAYGNMRELCLGLEVALPDGQVLNGLSRLKKDNTGYDLRDLFIGSEGTLGIITAAVLKLFPQPKGRAVAWAAVESAQQALALLGQARAGGNLTGFELVAHIGMAFTVEYMPGSRMPLETIAPWYVLAEFSSSRSQEDASGTMTSVLEAAFKAGTILDAAIASNKAQEDAFWALRENMSDAQKHAGGSIKHDISLPVASIPAFIGKAAAAVNAMIPGVRLVTFGHLGDGNLHYNVTQPVGMDKAAFLARWGEMNHLVHGIVHEFNGSISAEHGIGRLKRAELTHYKQPLALDLMRRIKAVFDPNGIMNPGKLI